jgi:Tfp pilus assembly protein PilV
MKPHPRKSITLLELLICITLIGLIVLGFFNIHIFSRYHLVTATRRANLQNEVSYILEHMAKKISGAIGDVRNYPINFTDPFLTVRVDSNQNGILDATDNFSAYEYNSTQHLLRFCSNFTIPTRTCNSGYEVVSRHITSSLNSTYVVFNNTTNYMTVSINACWEPDRATCGQSENPTVTMTSRIKMPSVSTR